MKVRPHLNSTVFSFETLAVVIFPAFDRVVLASPPRDPVALTVDETLEAIERSRELRKEGV
ncbi:MAG: hypothetical protein LN409_03925 [Candidatus Thermoplasmatota archaeon]|nr:hypothetical protein [Candidatus Thermoplasmatota archaeon]